MWSPAAEQPLGALNSERGWCVLAFLDPHAQVRVLYARWDPRDEPCQLQQRLSAWTATEQCRARPTRAPSGCGRW